MAINVASIWSYAGVSMREDEGGWADPNRIRALKSEGWGYVVPLILDGRTPQNRDHIRSIITEARRSGMGVVGWVTPRLDVPIAETVELTAQAVSEYGLDAVRYQTEAEFEYSNGSMGGTPAQRFDNMAYLGAEHRAQMGTKPAAVYARVGLNLADAWWAKAWQFNMRCFVECYGPSEGGIHPGWAAVAAPGSASPPLVGGWWYRTRLGTVVHMGRMDDDGRAITVSGQGTFPVGSPAGPRQIAKFGNPKWGAVLGFFPTSWVKIVVPSYQGAAGRPSGATLAREILDGSGSSASSVTSRWGTRCMWGRR